MPDTGWILASAGVNDATVGNRAWSNPGNIAADDGNWTNGSGIALFNTDSTSNPTNYLRAAIGDVSSIPSSATILGIEVRVERGEITAARDVFDDSVRLYIDGTGYVGNDQSDASEWAVSSGGTGDQELITYGGPADLWGLSSITRDDVVNNLEVGISAVTAIDGAAPVAGGLDRVEFKITYALAKDFTDAGAEGSESFAVSVTAQRAFSDAGAEGSSSYSIDVTAQKSITDAGAEGAETFGVTKAKSFTDAGAEGSEAMVRNAFALPTYLKNRFEAIVIDVLDD